MHRSATPAVSSRTVALVGSTGSIGTQAVEVVQASEGRFEVVALAAQSSIDLLAEQARLLHPALVAIGDPALRDKLAELVPRGTEVMAGAEGMIAAASAAQVVVNGVVGFAGLPVTLAALNAGRRLALANKESLVAGAPIVQVARSTPGAEIVPVDSEHCALHQCLASVSHIDDVARLWITASGGPFRGRSEAELDGVTREQALAHPTWKMGPKITIDSSTLMNKGLEVIEAHELFGIEYDRIEVVVHPQSIVHSMIELVDGTTLSQLSVPDMRLPIGYAIGYPERLHAAFSPVDWRQPIELTFEAPDRRSFRCLDLAYEAGRTGGGAPAWLNAANEVAVAAFLADRIEWRGIAQVVAETLQSFDGAPLDSLEAVLEADRAARVRAAEAVEAREEAA